MKPAAYPTAMVTLLIAVFVVVAPGQAAASIMPEPTAFLSAHALAVEEDEAEEESEGEESEAEENEEGEDEAETGRSEPGVPQGVPDRCLAYTVAARVVSSLSRQMVRLEVSYDSYESGQASLNYELKGSKGSMSSARRSGISHPGGISNAQLTSVIARS